MADGEQYLRPIEGPGITVAADSGMTVTSLRYFMPNGPFATVARRYLGVDLPLEPNAIAIADRPATVLTWRRPGECLLISPDSGIIDGIMKASGRLADGRAINLTDGTCVLRIRGSRSAELFSRIGGHDSMPPARSSRASRVAELPVILIRAQSDDMLLLVDRVYVEHLMQWLRASVADFAVH